MTLIRIELDIDKKRGRAGGGEIFFDVGALEDNFRRRIPEAMKKAQVIASKDAIAPLRAYPPPWKNAQSTFTWSNDPEKNDRARRYWFGKVKKQGGGVYKRTGNMGKAWAVDLETLSGGTQGIIRIYNKHKKSSYVYGAEQFNWKRVPSHERTGWLSADGQAMDKAVDSTFQTFIEQLDIVFTDVIGDI